MKLNALFAGGIAGLFAFGLGNIADADACRPAPESFRWSIPEEGGEILGDHPIYVAVQGGVAQDVSISLEDGANNPVDVDSEYLAMAKILQGMRVVSPTSSLAPGEYTLSVTYGGVDSDDIEVSFRVVESLPPSDVSQAVEFQWYRESFDLVTGDSCEFGTEYHMIILEELAETPVFYELAFVQDDDVVSSQILLPEEIADGLFAVPVADVECIHAWAVMADGNATDITKVCKPDRCIHYPDGEGPGVLGATDWDEIDGCDGEEDEGEEEDEEDEEDEGEEEDEEEEEEEDEEDVEDEEDEDVEDEDDIEDEDDAEDGESAAVEDGGCGGCASTSNPGGTVLNGVLAILGLALIRRRRGSSKA